MVYFLATHFKNFNTVVTILYSVHCTVYKGRLGSLRRELNRNETFGRDDVCDRGLGYERICCFSKQNIIDDTHENSEICISVHDGFLIKNKDGADSLDSEHSGSRWKTEMSMSLLANSAYQPKKYSSITFSSVSWKISEMALRSTDFSLSSTSWIKKEMALRSNDCWRNCSS